MVSERDRLENVNALNMVDLVCLLDTSLAEALRALRPDFVVKGKEYEDGDNPEAASFETYNGKLVFSSGSSVLSEADVIDGHFSPQPFVFTARRIYAAARHCSGRFAPHS